MVSCPLPTRQTISWELVCSHWTGVRAVSVSPSKFSTWFLFRFYLFLNYMYIEYVIYSSTIHSSPLQIVCNIYNNMSDATHSPLIDGTHTKKHHFEILIHNALHLFLMPDKFFFFLYTNSGCVWPLSNDMHTFNRNYTNFSQIYEIELSRNFYR